MATQPDPQTQEATVQQTPAELINQGDQLLKESKLAEAIVAYEQAVQLKPSSAAFHYKLGHALLQQGELEKAKACYEQSVELDPTLHWGHYGLAQVAYKLEQWEQAEALYRQVIELRPDFAVAEQELNLLLKQLQGQDAATAVDQPELALAPIHSHPELKVSSSEVNFHSSPGAENGQQSFEEWICQGDLLLEAQKFEQATRAYSQAGVIDPESATPYFKLGNIALKQQNLEKALQYFQTSLQHRPDFHWAYHGLGQVALEQQQWEKAIELFQQAVALQPGFSSIAHPKLQEAIEQLGKAQDRFQTVQRVELKLDSNQLNDHHFWENTPRLQDVLQPESILISQRERTLKELIEEGDRLLENHTLESAVKVYQQAIQVAPSSGAAYTKLGEVYLRQEEFDLAIEHFRRAIELEPNLHWGYYGLGQSMAKQKQWEQAIQAFRHAISIKPDFVYGYQKLGDILLESENWQEAETVFGQACRIDSKFHWGFYGLGQALLHQQKWKEASVSYERALALLPFYSNHRQQLKKRWRSCLKKLNLPDLQVIKQANGQFDGEISYVAGNRIVGWLTNRNSVAECGHVRLKAEDQVVSTAPANRSREEIPGAPEGAKGRCWFNLQIPDRYLDGQQYIFELLSPDDELLDVPIEYRFSLRGNLDILQKNYVAGWLLDPQSNYSLAIDLYLDDQKYASIVAESRRGDVTESFGCGFEASIPTKSHSSQIIYVTLKDSNIPILDTPKSLLFSVGVINALYKLGHGLRADQLALTPLERDWMLTQLLPNLIEGFRNSAKNTSSTSLNCSFSQTINRRKTAKAKEKVDVIIPIYRNFLVTKLCIESVLSTKGETPFNLIAVNDKSPEPEIGPYLEELASQGKLELLVNSTNQGFVYSVNLGMKLNSDRDIVLLNSDAIVNDYWLDRLKSAAYSDPNIASATPISNHASIFSYPRIAEEVEQMPGEIPAQEIDQICYSVNPDTLVDVPTNHGFCCFLRRAALIEVGLFDEHKWQKGYGEEVDWSQRSLRLGWRHVAVPGIFVHHVGSQSFSKNKEQAIAQALSKLSAEYPEFDATVQDFIKADPLAQYRRRIDIERLKRVAAGYMLYIAHDLGGGTRRHLNDMSSLLKLEDCPVLYLMPEQDGWIKLISPAGLDVHARYNLNKIDEFQSLIEDLKSIAVFHIHFHSTIGFAKDNLLWQIPERLQTAYDVTIHDYQTICPRVNLTNSRGRYCGEPTAESCDVCILKNGTYPADNLERFYQEVKTVAGWRSYFGEKLKKARKVFAPSCDAQQRLLKYFPDINLEVRYHPEFYRVDEPLAEAEAGDRCYRVAILGAISDIKGYNILYDCASYALDFLCPIEFVIFGFTKDNARLEELRNITLAGAFESFDQLQSSLQKYPCDLAAFLSTWPETYSYTLSEALMLGLTPVALKIGAFPERLQSVPNAVLLEPDASPETIVNRLVEAAKLARLGHAVNHEKFSLPTDHQYGSLLKDYYGLEV